MSWLLRKITWTFINDSLQSSKVKLSQFLELMSYLDLFLGQCDSYLLTQGNRVTSLMPNLHILCHILKFIKKRLFTALLSWILSFFYAPWYYHCHYICRLFEYAFILKLNIYVHICLNCNFILETTVWYLSFMASNLSFLLSENNK